MMRRIERKWIWEIRGWYKMRVLICVVNRWIEEYWMIDSGLSDIDMRMVSVWV